MISLRVKLSVAYSKDEINQVFCWKEERFRVGNVTCLLAKGEYMSVMSRKKKNTQLEQQKKLQREKDLKKKQMKQQLPAKGKK